MFRMGQRIGAKACRVKGESSSIWAQMRAADHLPERFNSADWFVGRHVREGRGASVAIVSDEGSMTYSELDAAVRAFASALKRAGVGRDERIALVLPDGPLHAIAFWGAIAAGAVAVPLSTLLKPHDYRAIVADCGARVVITDPAILDPRELADLDAELWTPDYARARLASSAPLAAYASTHRDGFAFFLYSSGTTGEPKGVVHLQHDMWICCETYGKHVLGIKPDDRCFSIAKLFFAYGLGNAGYFPFHVGGCAILFAGRPTPDAVFAQVKRHEPTLFFGVPTAYASMLAAMEAPQQDAASVGDFSSVRACVSAGESLPGPIFERWRAKTGREILDGIGSTEICHIFLSNRPGACKPGSTGVPVPGYDLRLVDETGSDTPRGDLGDLLVRGDSTAALYWNKHEQTKHTMRGDWIRTGDRYYQDEDGYFFHAGRSDDMIKAGGIWVSPVEVEAVLVAHAAVLECAVVGTADTDGLVKPHAFVTVRAHVTTDAHAALEVELKAFAKEKLAPYKAPRWITFVAELPKTATGKIQRFLLRAGTR
jgi:benzoate-CoA ligase family protein